MNVVPFESEIPERLLAGVVIPETGSLTITETVPEEKEKDIKKLEEIEEQNAKIEVGKQKYVEIFDIKMNINAIPFEDDKPETSTASVDIMESRPVVVSHTISKEIDDKIMETEKVKEEKATYKLFKKKSVEVSGTESNLDVVSFDSEKPEESSADIIIKAISSVQITEIVPEEKEDIMKKPTKIEEGNAKPEVRKQESVEVIDVKTDMHVVSFKDLKPETLAADIICSENKSIVISEIISEEKEDKMKKTKEVGKKKATRKITKGKSVQLSDIETDLNKVPFDVVKPVESSADIIVDEVHSVTIKETIPQEKGKDMKKPDKIREQEAKPEIIQQISVDVLDVMPDISVASLNDKIPKISTAIVDIQENQPAVVEENEDKLKVAGKTDKQKAICKISKKKSVQVCSTDSDVDVVPFDIEKPEESLTVTIVNKQQSIAVTETIPEEKEEKIKMAEGVVEEKATSKITKKKSVKVTDVDTDVNVIPFESKIPKGLLADVVVPEASSLSITETILEENVKDIKESEEIEKQKIKLKITTRETAEMLDVKTDINIPFKDEKHKISTAEVNINEVQPVVVTEVIPKEKEGKINTDVAEEKKVSLKITKKKSIQMADTEFDRNAVSFDNKKSEKASADFTIEESVHISAVNLPEKVSIFETSKPSIVSEETPQEQVLTIPTEITDSTVEISKPDTLGETSVKPKKVKKILKKNRLPVEELEDKKPVDEISPDITSDVTDKVKSTSVKEEPLSEKKPEKTETVVLKRKTTTKQSLKEEKEESKTDALQQKPSVKQLEEEVDIPSEASFTPRKSQTTEEIEQDFCIQMRTYGEEDVTLRAKVKIPRKKLEPSVTEEVDLTFGGNIPEEIPEDNKLESTPTVFRKVNVKEDHPVVEKVEKQQNTGEIKHPSFADGISSVEDTPEEVPSVIFIPRRSISTEEIEQNFNIQIQTYGEEDVTLKGKVKLPRRKSFLSQVVSVSSDEIPTEETKTAFQSMVETEESVSEEVQPLKIETRKPSFEEEIKPELLTSTELPVDVPTTKQKKIVKRRKSSVKTEEVKERPSELKEVKRKSSIKNKPEQLPESEVPQPIECIESVSVLENKPVNVPGETLEQLEIVEEDDKPKDFSIQKKQVKRKPSMKDEIPSEGTSMIKATSSEEVSVTLIPRKFTKTEEVEQDFNIQLQTYGQENVTLKSKIKLPRRKSKPLVSDEVSVSIEEQIPQETDITSKTQTPYIFEDVKDQVAEFQLQKKRSLKDERPKEILATLPHIKLINEKQREEFVEIQPEIHDKEEITSEKSVKLRPKKSKFIESEDSSDTITIKKQQKPLIDDEDKQPEDVSAIFRPKKTKTKEEIEQDFSIELKPYIKENVSLKRKVKLPDQKSKISPVSEASLDVSISGMPEKIEEHPEEINTVIKSLKTKTKEELERNFNVELKPYIEEDVSLKSTVKLTREKSETSTIPAQESTVMIELKPSSFDSDIDSVTLGLKQKVSKTKDEDESSSESVKIRRKTSKQYSAEDTSEDTTIQIKPVKPKGAAEEDTSVEKKIVLGKKGKPTHERSTDETSVVIEEPISEVRLAKRPKAKYHVEESTEEHFQVNIKKVPHKDEICEEETFDLKIRRKSSVPSYQRQVTEDYEFSVTKDTERPQDVAHRENLEGAVMFSIRLYIAENDETINLVEGERVIVLESSNPEWWFVRKHLTEEKGWVPAVYLRDEVSYNRYVQRKLHEKIDKLPIFQKPSPGDQVCAPKFVEKLQPKHVPDGATVQFECHVEGNPRPQITWFRQTAIIKPSQDFQIYYDEDNVATLIIREVFPEDAGVYTCVAKNSAGFASSTTELTVEAPLSDHGSDITSGLSRKSLSRESSLADILEGIPPTFSRKPKAVCVSEEVDVALECHLVAVPEPDVYWYHNGKPVKDSKNITITLESDMHFYVSKVIFKKVKKISEGTYTVVAKNREGEAKLDIILKVMTSKQEKPQILEPLEDATVYESETVVLNTQISGNPTPEVEWFKNDKPVTNLPIKVEGTLHTCILNSTTQTDTARYSVVATNLMGTAKTFCHLLVEKTPGPQAPLFVERFQEKSVKEKDTLKLTAKVTGNPVPLVTWFRNNKPLLASPKKTELYDGESIILEIKNADSEEDAGDYKCVASNSYGTVSHGARVTVDVEHVTFTEKLPLKMELNEKDIILLECETSHTVSTKWKFNGKDISGMDHREIIQEGRVHKLLIKQPTASDSGTYMCSVKDQETTCNVVVKAVKPEFVKKLEDVEVKELQTAILEVEITSKSADVTWHKNGEVIKLETEKFEMQNEGHTRKLLIRNISVHDDGEYTCSLGDQESTAEVTVVELPPEIIRKLENKKITIGERVTFDIELTKGDALVRWFKNSKEIQFNDNIKLTIDGKRQQLEILSAKLSDAGVYSCEVGDQKSVTKLTVESPAVTMLTKLPEVTVAPFNTDTTFTVKLSQPKVDVNWYKNGQEILPSDKYNIVSTGSTRKLTIKTVKFDDQDEYSCVAANVTTKTTLKVEAIEKVPRINTDALIKEYRVKKGDTVTFNIMFTAPPNPVIEWFVNGAVVKKSNKIKSSYTESSASLTIEKIEDIDIGNYTIRISNEYGEASAEFTLIMIEVPGVPEPPIVTDVTDSSITVFWKPPSYDGNSPIKSYVLEYHDKEEFMVWHKIETEETTFQITELTKNHEITFKVAAVNDAGISPYSDSSRYIKVISEKGVRKPVIEEPLKDTTIGLQKMVTLSCVITGCPKPEIKWLKDKKLIRTKNVSYENNVAKLVLSDTSEHTEGSYTCRAVNDAGSVETNCKVTIQDVPKIEVDENLSSQILQVRSQWKVEVKYSGYPTPKITWTKNEQPVEDDKCKIYIDDSSTTIAIYSVERTSTGTYCVTATNNAGSASANLQLKVIDKPSKPTGPVLMNDITSDSLRLEWKPPKDDGGLEITKYIIEKCETGKKIWCKVGEAKDITTYNVQKLLKDAEYMFRISAENAIGISEYLESEPVTVKCKYHKPSKPQGPLEISDMTDTSMVIKWLPPIDNGGLDILDYMVEIKEISKKAWQKVGITKDLTIAVTKLCKGSSYVLRIFARNRIGFGEPFITEEPIVAGRRINFDKDFAEKTLYALMGIFPTTSNLAKLSPPSPPTNLKIIGITSKSATLQWSPPESNGGSEITGYVVEKQLLNDKWFKVVTLEPSVLQYYVENLREKSEYYFRIFAENSVSLSEAVVTDLVSLETHASVPSLPTAPLEIRSLSSNAVDVGWGVPETDGGSPLTGYAIAIKDIKKTMWMEVGRVAADVQKLTIRDLQENHEYLFRIFARNEVGLSDPLESEEAYKVQKPFGVEEDTDLEETVMDKPSMSISTETTTSWMKEAGMDADIESYAEGSLLKRSEYFFRIWYYARQLFK